MLQFTLAATAMIHKTHDLDRGRKSFFLHSVSASAELKLRKMQVKTGGRQDLLGGKKQWNLKNGELVLSHSEEPNQIYSLQVLQLDFPCDFKSVHVAFVRDLRLLHQHCSCHCLQACWTFLTLSQPDTIFLAAGWEWIQTGSFQDTSARFHTWNLCSISD